MRKKPTNLKILEGNPGRRPLLANQPKPKPLAPKCPASLPKEAKKHWEYLAPKLEALGLLTEVDGPALTDFCLCLARLEEAEKIVQENGMLIPGERGLVKNPAAQLAREYRSAAQKWCARLGLDPQSRSGMDVTKPNSAQDEMETFLKAGNNHV